MRKSHRADAAAGMLLEPEHSRRPARERAHEHADRHQCGLADQLAERPADPVGAKQREAHGAAVDVAGDGVGRGEQHQERHEVHGQPAVEERHGRDGDDRLGDVVIAGERPDHAGHARARHELLHVDRLADLLFQALANRDEDADEDRRRPRATRPCRASRSTTALRDFSDSSRSKLATSRMLWEWFISEKPALGPNC